MDAKYKHMEKSTIDGDDMHQIISYMHILDMEIGSFIYPKETTANDIKTDTHDIGVLNGKGGMVQTYAFPIQTGLKEYGALKRRWRKLKHHLYKQLKRKKIY